MPAPFPAQILPDRFVIQEAEAASRSSNLAKTSTAQSLASCVRRFVRSGEI
jgi:hypothetical protein